MADITVLGTLASDSYGSATKVSSFAVTASRAVPAGRSVVVFVAVEADTPPTVLSATDAKGNTYTACGTPATSGTRQVGVLYGNITSALANGDSITVNTKDGSAAPLTHGKWDVIVLEASGLIAAPLDVYYANGSAGASQQPMVLTSGMTPAQASELWVYAASMGPSNTFTAPTGWTNGGTEDTLDEAVATNAHKLAIAYQVKDSSYTPAAITTTGAAQSSNATWAAVLVTFKAAATESSAPSTATGTGWTRVGGSTNPGVLSDASDATYLLSPDNPTDSELDIAYVAYITNPSSGQTGSFVLRLASDGASSADVDVSLYRSGSGTALQTWTAVTITSTPTDYVFTLGSTAMNALIANPGNTRSIKMFATAAV